MLRADPKAGGLAWKAPCMLNFLNVVFALLLMKLRARKRARLPLPGVAPCLQSRLGCPCSALLKAP